MSSRKVHCTGIQHIARTRPTAVALVDATRDWFIANDDSFITFENINLIAQKTHGQNKRHYRYKSYTRLVGFCLNLNIPNEKIHTNDQLPHAPRPHVVRVNPRTRNARNHCRTDDWLTHRYRHATDPREQPRPFPTTAATLSAATLDADTIIS